MNTNNFEKFTQNAKNALIAAQREAKKAGVSHIGTEHLLIGILSQRGSLGADILFSFGVDLEKIYLAISFSAFKDKNIKTATGLTENAKKVIEFAVDSARKVEHTYVGTEHLLSGLVSLKENAAYEILKNIKVSPEQVRAQIDGLFEELNAESFIPAHLRGEKQTPLPKKSKTPALDYFSVDLTQKAKSNELDPVIGRAKEVERMIQILNRRNKNNPVLIGDPGVGKTAIVEGLAQRIVSKDVPEGLLEKRILSLDLAGLIAGTKYRGEFEDRLKKLLDEAKKNKEIILFIDEFHTVIGAGAAEGALDMANIIKPALSRGEIRAIGATTIDEYRKYIEKDAALERRFQPIIVEEPTVEDTIEILNGIKEKYEEFHNITITKEAIELAAKLSARYIQDRFLPDKAIDLIDEASSRAKIKYGVLKKSETKLEEELKKIIAQKEEAVISQEYELAASLRQEELVLREKLEKQKIDFKKSHKNEIKIDGESIAHIVSVWTGIPVTRLVETETKKILNLEKILTEKIIGQDEAVLEIAKAIKRARVGLGDPKRPIGSFIFLGPTGVGKTELAKVLAARVFGSEDALIKIDMSEFMEKHNVSRLVGAPPGYVGYEESGKLTEAVRKKPYAVILLDEIEKAHSDVFNMLLQIMEDGYLTDAKGKKVSFKNTIIIMTSNIGVSELNKQATLGFSAKSKDDKKNAESKYEEIKNNIEGRLKEFFKPEFLNRLDKVIIFRPLSQEVILNIVDIQLKDLSERIKDEKIEIDVTKNAKKFLATAGFNPEFGARPLRRTIQVEIGDRLAEMMLLGEVKKGDSVVVDVKANKIIINRS